MSNNIDINAKPQSLYQAGQIIGALKIELKNSKYYRYLNAVRNEIAKFDKFAYSTTPKFRYNDEELEYFSQHHTYEELQTEKRRLRWIHILENSMDDPVRDLQNKISNTCFKDEFGNTKTFTYDEFAELVASGYALISDEIHTLTYHVTFGGEYWPKTTNNKEVNFCVNIIMANVELDVGEMVPKTKKQKLDLDTSS